MTESDIQKVEEKLKVKLPRKVCKVLLDFPQALIKAAAMEDGDGNEFFDSMDLSHEPDVILQLNSYRMSGWPQSYVVVGDNGCGDGFCIDTADENCPVYLFGPHNDAMAAGPDEEGFFELLSADFKEWVDNLVSNCG